MIKTENQRTFGLALVCMFLFAGGGGGGGGGALAPNRNGVRDLARARVSELIVFAMTLACRIAIIERMSKDVSMRKHNPFTPGFGVEPPYLAGTPGLRTFLMPVGVTFAERSQKPGIGRLDERGAAEAISVPLQRDGISIEEAR